MDSQLQAFGLLQAAAIVIASGIWLARAGRPYRIALLTAHKLVDLGAVIAIGWIVYRAHGAAALATSVWAVVGAAALFMVAAFATGGVVSANAEAPSWVARLHGASAWLATILSAGVLYLVARA